MSEHTAESRPPNEESLARGYEVADVRSGPLLMSALVLALAVALVCGFLIWFVGRLETTAERENPVLSPLADTGWQPPGPRLQTDPANDLARMRAAEDRALRGYRWIDKKEGVVQLPIDRAMDLLLEQGLPETSAEVPRVEPADESEEQKSQ